MLPTLGSDRINPGAGEADKILSTRGIKKEVFEH